MWICINIQKISYSICSFFRYCQFQSSITRLATPISDHANLQNFQSHFSLHESCMNYQHAKNQLIPTVHFWDTVNFRVQRTYWSHTFLTIPNQNIFDQILIFLNLYQHAKKWGSFYKKSPEFKKTSHLTLMDFVEILSGECIHQEIKILKILSFYHVQFGNYDQLKYGPFCLYTKPLKVLSFWSWFYSAIFNRKYLKFGLTIHFHTIT